VLIPTVHIPEVLLYNLTQVAEDILVAAPALVAVFTSVEIILVNIIHLLLD
jgi:hypothetical protein